MEVDDEPAIENYPTTTQLYQLLSKHNERFRVDNKVFPGPTTATIIGMGENYMSLQFSEDKALSEAIGYDDFELSGKFQENNRTADEAAKARLNLD
jgi:hypothetical protein